jgi:hypothetical protein
MPRHLSLEKINEKIALLEKEERAYPKLQRIVDETIPVEKEPFDKELTRIRKRLSFYRKELHRRTK